MNVGKYKVTNPARLTIGKTWTTVVLKGDKDPYNKGLNPRTEVTILKDHPLGLMHILFSCKASNNVTFLQVMGRNALGEGKPIMSLDTHNGFVNFRLRNFADESMIRTKLFMNSDWIDGMLQLDLALKGSADVNINNIHKSFSGPMRWANSKPAWIQFGSYLTNYVVNPTGKTEYAKLNIT
jgi:hypothetical protein